MSKELNCWESESEWIEETFGPYSKEKSEYYEREEGPRTCILPLDHEGPHEWTPNDEIVIAFVGEKPSSVGRGGGCGDSERDDLE